jgi:hypothetical protein
MADANENVEAGESSESNADEHFPDFKTATPDQRFQALGQYFLRTVESLRQTHEGLADAARDLDDLSSIIGPVAERVAREATSEQQSAVRAVFDSVPEDGVDPGDFIRRMWEATSDAPWGPDLVSAISETAQRRPREPLFHGAMLTSAVSSVEAHFAHLAEEYFRAAPDALHDVPKDSAKEFSLRDVMGMDSIEDAVETAIESRISDLSYGNLTGWKAFFRDRLKVDLGDLAPDWDQIIEIFERRNCIVHHEGSASKRYVRAVGSGTVGNGLETDYDYVQVAIGALELLGIRLHVAVWQKFNKSAIDVITWLEAASFAVLRREQWSTSLALYETWQTLPLTRDQALLAHVNLLLAKKGLHGLDATRGEIEAWDVSGLDEIYTFAKATLLDDLDRAFAMAPALIEREKLGGWALATWPLTKGMRSDARIQQYADLMKEYLSESTSSGDDDSVAANEPEEVPGAHDV